MLTTSLFCTTSLALSLSLSLSIIHTNSLSLSHIYILLSDAQERIKGSINSTLLKTHTHTHTRTHMQAHTLCAESYSFINGVNKIKSFFFSQSNVHDINVPNHLDRLDHLRFFACVWVVVRHFRNASGVRNTDILNHENIFVKVIALWQNAGGMGVDIFFVLSGFLFAVIIRDRKVIYHKFLYNRVLRIFPLFSLALMIIMTTAVKSINADFLWTILMLLSM